MELLVDELYRALSTKHNAQRTEFENLQREKAENKSTMKLLVESHRDALEQTKKELAAQHEAATRRQREEITAATERRRVSEIEAMTAELEAVRSEMDGLRLRHLEQIEVGHRHRS